MRKLCAASNPLRSRWTGSHDSYENGAGSDQNDRRLSHFSRFPVFEARKYVAGMCGIAGIWNTGGRPVEEHVLCALTDRMSHRGPDASGIHTDGDVGLGHRRLSIIDLEHSHQPMQDESGRYWIVYNGELYNFRELREELIGLKFQFRTSGDTEVILAAYKAWGVACLKRFRGMFAVAIWDNQSRELFLARDRFGIKPLCICRHDQGLAFASEIEAFGAFGPRFKRQVTPETLDLYLYYGYIPAPQSIFRDVHKLPPAHFCLLREPDQEIAYTRYWEYRFAPDSTLDEAGWQEGLESKLCDAVHSHLVADVPIGAFLSGGIDSSVVVATMSRVSSSSVDAYTIGFDHEAFDERPITRESSRRIPVEYHEQELKLDVLGTLDVLVQHYGEPFADSSAVCTYQVTGTAARDVKVMLSGDGGDEIFCGYSHYGWMLREFLPTFRPAMRARLMVGDLLRRLGLRSARMTPVDAWVGRNGYFSKADRETLWLDSYRNLPSATEAYLHDRFEPLRRTRTDSLIDTVQSLDIADYLPYNNLNKVDIASMCHGLEVRVPLLDHELAEFAARIPWKERIREHSPDRQPESAMHGYVNKYALRSIAEKTYGHGFFDRKKMGFAMPISSWLASDDHQPLLKESLTSANSPLLQYFDKRHLESLLRKHRSTETHGHQLWSLLFLSRWLQWTAA